VSVLAATVVFLILASVVFIMVWSWNRSFPITRPPGIQVRSTRAYAWYSAETENSFLVPVVRDYLDSLPPGASIIDLGCGNGAALAELRSSGSRLVGLDISESGIRIAKKNWPDIQFEVADATGDLSRFGYGSYDAVISTDVVEHICLPRQYTENCFRLLKPGGRLIMTTNYHGYAKNLAIAVVNSSDHHWNPLWDYGHVKFWSVKTLSTLLFESGFDRLEWRGVGRLPYLWKGMVFRAYRPQ
jgi:SAM-dependent methyltransferase